LKKNWGKYGVRNQIFTKFERAKCQALLLKKNQNRKSNSMSTRRTSDPNNSEGNYQLETASRRKSQFWLLQIILLLCAWMAGFSTAFYKWKINEEGAECLKVIKGADEAQRAFLLNVDKVLGSYIEINDLLKDIRYLENCAGIEKGVKEKVSDIERKLKEAKAELAPLENAVTTDPSYFQAINEKVVQALREIGELAVPLVNVYKVFSCKEVSGGGGEPACDCTELNKKITNWESYANNARSAYNRIDMKWSPPDKRMRKNEFTNDWAEIKTQLENIK
jgi:hypothetical protein